MNVNTECSLQSYAVGTVCSNMFNFCTSKEIYLNKYDLRDRKQASGDSLSICNFLALSVSFFSDLTIAHKI